MAASLQSVRDQLPRALAHPIPFLAAWLIGGLLAIVIPVSRWKKEKNSYYSYYGQWNEYNEENRDDENNDNNNYYYQKCKWYQWSCNDYDNWNKYNGDNNNNNNDRNNLQLPGWYRYFGGMTEEERRWREENFGEDMTNSSGALKFVYAWTLIMFLGILAYGVYAMLRNRQQLFSGGLLVATITFCQFTFLGMLLLVQGVIQTDDRELEDSIYGWWGQTGVLIFMTNFGYTIFCLVFSVIMAAMGCYAFFKQGGFQKRQAAADAEDKSGKSDQYYNANDDWEAPKTQVT